MTPAQIAALTDAELSAALAERVMGWTRAIQDTPRPGHGVWAVRVRPGEMLDEDDNRILCRQCDWSPATSLDQVARCTEVMIEAGWTIEITLYKKIGCSCTIWRFSEGSLKGLDLETAEMFDTREKQQDRHHVRAATEARAKAEACLLAKVREEEE